ncbi:hypothetical protein BU15DRAFT_47320 [Melanogaster broomeanus]|nr:hypothetical protein BU15DRAFT_47320 [Melanogaster broomeanus]
MPSEETKERILKVVEFGRTVIHYGWIPMIIYIGYTRSTPQPMFIKCALFLLVSFIHSCRFSYPMVLFLLATPLGLRTNELTHYVQ